MVLLRLELPTLRLQDHHSTTEPRGLITVSGETKVENLYRLDNSVITMKSEVQCHYVFLHSKYMNLDGHITFT